jgi:ferredoxin/flavodoxin---NADP+ reductase
VTHVITRACCNDAACVAVCPVDCIHPTTDEPGFATAEMLYIDPGSCIDCGACVVVCPVQAIKPDDELAAHELPFAELNAVYFTDRDVEVGSTIVSAPQKSVELAGGGLTVAVVGAGPAGFYVAEELLKHPNVAIHMFDRLPTPYGLIRSGVAPDHVDTKMVADHLAKVATSDRFEYYLNVEVGRDISVDELRERYSAVVFSHGAPASRSLAIPNSAAPNVVSGVDVVAWYNGHPDANASIGDLLADRVVLVGNGNVALDIARILSSPPAELRLTDVAEHALDAIERARATQTTIVGRRGVEHAAYTNAEFIGLNETGHLRVVTIPADLALSEAAESAQRGCSLDSVIATKIGLARRQAHSEDLDLAGAATITIRYCLVPTGFVVNEAGRATALECRHADADGRLSDDPPVTIEAELFITAIGYAGEVLPGLPFDAEAGAVPNVAGRVIEDGVHSMTGTYVTGWAKRGGHGGIGRNRMCARETAAAILHDASKGALRSVPAHDRAELVELLAARGVRVLDGRGWASIDQTERDNGSAEGRPRIKLVDYEHLVGASAARVRQSTKGFAYEAATAP